MARICFLNPFGTDSYDELIESTLRPALHGSTDVEIRHLSHARATSTTTPPSTSLRQRS